jgi:hypothetical protein
MGTFDESLFMEVAYNAMAHVLLTHTASQTSPVGLLEVGQRESFVSPDSSPDCCFCTSHSSFSSDVGLYGVRLGVRPAVRQSDTKVAQPGSHTVRHGHSYSCRLIHSLTHSLTPVECDTQA